MELEYPFRHETIAERLKMLLQITTNNDTSPAQVAGLYFVPT